MLPFANATLSTRSLLLRLTIIYYKQSGDQQQVSLARRADKVVLGPPPGAKIRLASAAQTSSQNDVGFLVVCIVRGGRASATGSF
jgi:hypothetical protein